MSHGYRSIEMSGEDARNLRELEQLIRVAVDNNIVGDRWGDYADDLLLLARRYDRADGREAVRS